MSFQLYLSNRWIRRHSSSCDEIERLLAIAKRDIQQSQTPGLGPEWRFDIAYNAALQLATAALAASGYQAERQSKHMRTIECLAFTVGLDEKTVAFLDRCRRKRHAAVNDQIGAISDQESDEMIDMAKLLLHVLESWLLQHHQELLR